MFIFCMSVLCENTPILRGIMYHKTQNTQQKRDKMLNYISTRESNHKVSSSQAVLDGLAKDGGTTFQKICTN